MGRKGYIKIVTISDGSYVSLCAEGSLSKVGIPPPHNSDTTSRTGGQLHTHTHTHTHTYVSDRFKNGKNNSTPYIFSGVTM